MENNKFIQLFNNNQYENIESIIIDLKQFVNFLNDIQNKPEMIKNLINEENVQENVQVEEVVNDEEVVPENVEEVNDEVVQEKVEEVNDEEVVPEKVEEVVNDEVVQEKVEEMNQKIDELFGNEEKVKIEKIEENVIQVEKKKRKPRKQIVVEPLTKESKIKEVKDLKPYKTWQLRDFLYTQELSGVGKKPILMERIVKFLNHPEELNDVDKEFKPKKKRGKRKKVEEKEIIRNNETNEINFIQDLDDMNQVNILSDDDFNGDLDIDF